MIALDTSSTLPPNPAAEAMEQQIAEFRRSVKPSPEIPEIVRKPEPYFRGSGRCLTAYFNQCEQWEVQEARRRKAL